MKCYVCGRGCLNTVGAENDVWVIDGDRRICGQCYIRVMDKLCENMEQESKLHIEEEMRKEREGRYIYEAFNGDYGTV